MDANQKPEWLAENPDHSLTVTLSRPYEVDGAERATITLREPTVADQKAFLPTTNSATPRQQADMETKMLAAIADGVPPALFNSMSLRDYQRLQTAFGFFLD